MNLFLCKFKIWISSPRTITLFILGIVFCYCATASMYGAAAANGYSINILEPICFLLSSKISVFVLSIMCATLFADGPFTEKNASFILYRYSRTKYYINNLIFSVICVVLYFVILLFAVCLIFSQIGYLSNDWSKFTYYLTHTTLTQHIGPQILTFSSAFLITMNPYDFLMTVFLLNILYIMLLITLMNCLRMMAKNLNGFIIVLILHICWSIMADQSIYIQVLSPFSHTLMENHSFGHDYKPDVLLSMILLSGLVVFLSFLCGYKTRKMDLSKER